LASYRVNLDVFAGPLDLLLYLVRKEEVDIYDIPIARITNQYLQYIEMLKNLDIDIAGDFLVMAATLMQIKSAMLLPKADPDQLEAGDLEDPRTELIRQLLEYKKFKDAANLLDAAADKQKQRFARPDRIIDQLRTEKEPQIDIDQVSIWDLLKAFDSIMKATGSYQDISHIKDDTPIDLYQIEILHQLQTEGPGSFETLFGTGRGRLVMIGLFLGLLELIREGLVRAEQTEPHGAIYLRALTDEPAEQAVQRAITALTTESPEPEAAPPGNKKADIPIAELPGKTRRRDKTHSGQTSPASMTEVPGEKTNHVAEKSTEPEPPAGPGSS